MPDFIAVTDHGVICTGGSKLAEHGGFSDDDRNVGLIGLDWTRLDAVKTEATRPLVR